MIELIKCLIRRGANIRGSSNTKHSLLIRAAAARVFPVVDLLLSSGSQADQEDADGLFPLLAAIIGLRDGYGNALEARWKLYSKVYDTVECLLKHGANAGKVNACGQTALMALCCQLENMPDQLEIIKLLVSYGADINLQSKRPPIGDVPGYNPHLYLDVSPIQMAFTANMFDICHYFLRQGVESPCKDEELLLMLKYLVKTVHEFPNARTPITGRYNSEKTHDLTIDPMECNDMFCASLRVLLEIDRDGWLAKNREALRLSTFIHHFPLTQRFLASGASDASFQTSGFGTCLHCLVSSRNATTMACAQRLIDIGADVDVVDYWGQSALTALLTLDCGPDRHGRVDADVGEFVNLMMVLLNNGITQREGDIQHFKDLARKERCCGDEDAFCMRLQRELRAHFSLEDGKIVARNAPFFNVFTGINDNLAGVYAAFDDGFENDEFLDDLTTMSLDPLLTYDPQKPQDYDPAGSYWFPLHAAAKAGCNEIIGLLVKHGSYLDLPSECLSAINHDRYDVARCLLRKGAENPVPPRDLLDMLEFIVLEDGTMREMKGLQRRLDFILEIDTNRTLVTDPRALEIATGARHLPLVEILIDKGTSGWGDRSLRSSLCSALCSALRGCDRQRMVVLAQRFSSLGADGELERCLHEAIKYNAWDVTKLLLHHRVQFKLDECREYRDRGMPLALAMLHPRAGTDDMISWILSANDLSKDPTAYAGYLQLACDAALPRTIATLVNAGVDVDSKYQGPTPLDLFLRRVKFHRIKPKPFVDAFKILTNGREYLDNVAFRMFRELREYMGRDEWNRAINDQLSRHFIIGYDPESSKFRIQPRDANKK
ncbi:hypothetical protein Hte_011827 [Hypoxylon texense]